jgi:tetratricopeptide (TPR) repeat protein
MTVSANCCGILSIATRALRTGLQAALKLEDQSATDPSDQAFPKPPALSDTPIEVGIMLKRSVGGPGLALVLFLLLVVVQVTAQISPGAPPADPFRAGVGISGTVLSPTGQRFSRRISVRLRSMSQGDRVTTTDDKGNFAFNGVPRGDYVVIIDKEQNFEPYSENVSVTPFSGAPYLSIRLRLKGEAKSAPGVINAELANVPSRALAFYQKAQEQAQAGNHKAAIEQLQKAIAEYSNFMLAFNELGVQYLRLGELDKADESLAKALKLAPESATPLLTHGILLTVMGKFNLAVTELQTALKQKGQSANGHLYLGQALANLGRFAEAEVSLTRAIELGGDEIKDAHRFLGAIYLQRGEREKALAEFEIYLKLAPKAKDAEKVRQIIRQNKPSQNHERVNL